MAEDGNKQQPGIGKNGRPYKEGNTREDGSFCVGKGRTSVDTRFAKNDGRARGRRAKGTLNLSTDWKEELAEKVEITENGKRKTITKQRGIVKGVASRAMKSSDRAAEIAFRHAAERDQRAGQLRLPDKEIMERWLAQRFGQQEESRLLDDADRHDAERDDPATGGEDGNENDDHHH